jgi:hypothetical protein
VTSPFDVVQGGSPRPRLLSHEGFCISVTPGLIADLANFPAHCEKLKGRGLIDMGTSRPRIAAGTFLADPQDASFGVVHDAWKEGQLPVFTSLCRR